MYVDCDDPAKNVQDEVEVDGFGGQDAIEEDRFSTVDVKYKFNDPLDIEAIQANALDCLANESVYLVSMTKDLVLKGFWPLLINMLNMAETGLKMSALNIMTKFMEQNCLVKNSKLLFNFVTLSFYLLLKSKFDECIVEAFFTSLWGLCQKDEILGRICDQESVSLWSKISNDPILWNVTLSPLQAALIPFLRRTLHLASFPSDTLGSLDNVEDIFSQIIVNELTIHSSRWKEEAEKLTKLDQGHKA